MNFAEQLIRLRKSEGVTQKELAQQLGVNVTTYQRYEYGDRTPQLPELIALADYVSVIEARKHPFADGARTAAREGVEY